jgi:hypothetical protein
LLRIIDGDAPSLELLDASVDARWVVRRSYTL